jgi:hypothetical protein
MSLVDDDFETVVLLGCSGSGKSYLASALRRMPETLYVDELIFPPCLAFVLGQDITPETRSAIQAGLVANMMAYANAGITRSRLHGVADFALRNISFSDFLLKLRKEYRIRRFVLESNFFSFVPDFFFDSLERVKVIHVVRDGRECAAKLNRNFSALSDEKLKGLRSPEALFGSYHAKTNRYTPSWLPEAEADAFQASSGFLRCIWFWRELVSHVKAFMDSATADQAANMLTINFEGLAKDPHGTLDKVTNFLSDRRVETLRLFPASIRIDPGIDSFLANLDPQELMKAYELAKPQLSAFGYGPKINARN